MKTLNIVCFWTVELTKRHQLGLVQYSDVLKISSQVVRSSCLIGMCNLSDGEIENTQRKHTVKKKWNPQRE